MPMSMPAGSSELNVDWPAFMLANGATVGNFTGNGLFTCGGAFFPLVPGNVTHVRAYRAVATAGTLRAYAGPVAGIGTPANIKSGDASVASVGFVDIPLSAPMVISASDVGKAYYYGATDLLGDRYCSFTPGGEAILPAMPAKQNGFALTSMLLYWPNRGLTASPSLGASIIFPVAPVFVRD